MLHDSYSKWADQVLGVDHVSGVCGTGYLKHVHPNDIDEVKVQFALLIHDLEYVDNFRVFPLSMTKEYKERYNMGCCGYVDTQIKCRSGRIYWAGANYGH